MTQLLNRKAAGVTLERPVKVLQFGAGNFLRAFSDWIVDVLNEKTDFNGAVQIIQSINAGVDSQINDQDGLYHLIQNGLKDGQIFKETRLISCVKGAFNPYNDYQEFLGFAENPDLMFIVSNTTEAGIAFDSNDLDINNIPYSFPGKLTALLYHRYKHFKGAGDKGLILLPCELIERNGDTLKQMVIKYITYWKLPLDFLKWIKRCNTFCNTLVDRIVPGFPKDTIKEIYQEIGFEDKLVVTAEPFHFWVIEANEKVRKAFPADKAGLQVKFVSDLSPYRTQKVRILNGAHTALVPVAYLYGLRTVRESVEDDYIGKFIRNVVYEEILPTLDLPEAELKQFAKDVFERFQNPYIKHELMSISLNSISKFKVRVLPSVLEYIKRKKQLPDGLLYSLAALILFYKGKWQNQKITLNDTPEVLNFFKEVWQENDPKEAAYQVLRNKDFWDEDLTKIKGLKEKVVKSMFEIIQAYSQIETETNTLFHPY